MTKRRKFSDQFKAKVALEALRGDRTIQEIAAKHRLHPTQVSTWKRQAVEGLSGVFSEGGQSQGPNESEIKDLHAKIGRLAVENDFWCCHINFCINIDPKGIVMSGWRPFSKVILH